jgi:hypothetical protein
VTTASGWLIDEAHARCVRAAVWMDILTQYARSPRHQLPRTTGMPPASRPFLNVGSM